MKKLLFCVMVMGAFVFSAACSDSGGSGKKNSILPPLTSSDYITFTIVPYGAVENSRTVEWINLPELFSSTLYHEVLLTAELRNENHELITPQPGAAWTVSKADANLYYNTGTGSANTVHIKAADAAKKIDAELTADFNGKRNTISVIYNPL